MVSGLAKANIIESAGRVIDSHRMLLTVVTANISQPEQVAAVPIANVGGQPVMVRDIGSVDLGIREDLDLYTRIRATIASIADTLRDMNALTLDQHEKSNFEELYRKLESRR